LPVPTLATNDHITPKQHAVSELNEFNDHIELDVHSNLALNGHINDASDERVNLFKLC